MNSIGTVEPNLSHFTDFPNFRLVRRKELVVLYERMYGHFHHFIPLKNKTTDELERCVIRLEISSDLASAKREIKISVYRHFPSGTDYNFHEIEDLNQDQEIAPVNGLHRDGEFFFEDWSGFVYRGKSKKSYSIPHFLEQLYQAHVRPCRTIVGYVYRKRRAFAHKVPDFTERAFPVIKTLLKVISGKRLEFDYSDPNNREEFLMEPIKYSRIKPIPEWTIKTPVGYECARPTDLWSILTILISIYAVYKFAGIDKNSVLIAMIAFISCLVFLVYDFVIPLVLLFIMNRMIKNQYSFEPDAKI